MLSVSIAVEERSRAAGLSIQLTHVANGESLTSLRKQVQILKRFAPSRPWWETPAARFGYGDAPRRVTARCQRTKKWQAIQSAIYEVIR